MLTGTLDARAAGPGIWPLFNKSGAQFSNAQMEGARFADCVLLGIGGVTSPKGVIINSRDAQGLVFSLANAIGIIIDDTP